MNLSGHSSLKNIRDADLGDSYIAPDYAPKDTEEDDEENFTNCEGVNMILYQSLWPIIGNLLHPSYMTVNAVLMGQMKSDPENCPDTLTHDE